MEKFVPIVTDAALKLIESERGVESARKEPNFSQENKELMQINLDSIDERSAAINCIGYLVKNCLPLMRTHFERIFSVLSTQAEWYHVNIRLEVVQTYKNIVEGMAQATVGDLKDFTPVQGVAAELSDECHAFVKDIFF